MSRLDPLRRLLAPPVFAEDEEKTRKARYANAIALTFIVIVLGYEIGTRAIRNYSGFDISDIILIGFAIVNLAGWILLKRGYLTVTSTLLVVLIWIAANGIAAAGFGIRDTAYITNFSIAVMAGLLLGWRASVAVTMASVLSGFGLAYAEENGIINSASYPPSAFAQDMVFIFGLNIVLIYLLINGLENEIKRSKTSLRELEASNLNLHQTQSELEKRTAELLQRGSELEIANRQIGRRADQFESLSQVARSVISIRDVQELLPRITSLISEKYGYYHVGIFLLDELNEYAILSAANSEGGRRMLERGHRLRVGEQGIVGYVTATGEPRIALDVGKDAVFFNNPDLPDTHSEMALPLRSGGRVVGALDVQSTETGAFSEEDVQSLSLLADQVSLAIENARLFEETRRALAELQMISRQITREAWKRLPEQQRLIGYRYDVSGAVPLKEPLKSMGTASGDGKGRQQETSLVEVPIELRGEVIGTLLVQSPAGGSWNEDQLDLIRAVAERVAFAAENARLFEETTLRAERERLVSEITGKIRSHTDPQAMLQTAINELREALGASRVEIIPQTVKGGRQEQV
jgi:GAF domain-containing protein